MAEVFFKINVKEGNEGFHKKVCMYGAGVIMALDISLSVFNHFSMKDAAAQTPKAQAKSTGRPGTATGALKSASAPVPQFEVSSARNPIVHWYEYYFCRGFQSGWGCSNRSMRATTSLDLDPKIAAQSGKLTPQDSKIIRDTYSIDILDRASGNTKLE